MKHRHQGTRTDLVLGKNAVMEVLRARPERLIEIRIAQRREDGDEVMQLAHRSGIPAHLVDMHYLSKLSGTESHQGVVGLLKPRVFEGLKEALARLDASPSATLVMLDDIVDPHNLGTCLRACECFGVDGIIISHNRGAPISPAATKASSGASELVNLIDVANLAQSMERCHDAGFESVVTAIGAGAQPLSGFHFPARTLLIVGSEGDGVQPLIQKKANHRLYIPMKGRIDSLNVSQALAVVLSHRVGGA